ncbi:MAG: pentapeptide repeat-containing protein, partial [Bacteroidales bacterium]|nr:pentapeptide repeat-containing protein [Bacteroidales bacterium]
MKKKIIFIVLFTSISLATFSQQRCNYFRFQFDTIANFYKVKFDSIADFYQANFNFISDFRQAQFVSEANIEEAQFHSDAYFAGTQFRSIADFQETIFKSCANFESAHFRSYSYFRKDQFDSIAVFRDVLFDSTTNFSESQFHSDADFMGAQFNSTADFSESEFYAKVDFRSAKLPYYLNFSDVQVIKGEIDFTNSVINEKLDICKINLINSNIDKIRFRYSRFKLFFPKDTDTELKSNVYEELLSNMEKEGFTASYEKLDKEYQSFIYLEGGGYGRIWGYFRNWLDKNWSDYGYEKMLIIRNTLILYFLFVFINCFYISTLVSKIYKMPKLQKVLNDIKKKSRPLVLINFILVSLFYTSIIFF